MRCRYRGSRQTEGHDYPFEISIETRLARVIEIRGGRALVRMEAVPTLWEMNEVLFALRSSQAPPEGVPGLLSFAVDDLEPVAEHPDIRPMMLEREKRRRRRKE